MSDDGFHEIQLNGKQLVFLFMAATVVSVVIFLCGVMVGRGVRADRADAMSGPSDLAATTPAPAPVVPSAPVTAAAKATAAAEPPAPPDEDTTKTDPTMKTLAAEHPKDTELPSGHAKAASAKPAAPEAKPPAVKPPAAEVKPAPVAPAHTAAQGTAAPTPQQAAAAEKPTTVTSGGFAVQITALRDRSEADAIVKRLAAKGYPAYILNPLPGKPPVYRVQVGRFQDRAEADRIASRLQKEEQFSPWVTR